MRCVTSCCLLAFSAFAIVLAGKLKDPCETGASVLDAAKKTAHGDITSAVNTGASLKKNMDGCLDYDTPITNTVTAGKNAVTTCTKNKAEKHPSECCTKQINIFTGNIQFIVTTTQTCIAGRQ